MLLLQNIHDFSEGLAKFNEGYILHLLEILEDPRGTLSRRNVIIYFHATKILYCCDGWLHKIGHPQTVWYIYYLMAMLNAPWMSVILNHIKAVFPLQWKIMVKDFPYAKGESSMRRFLSNPRTFLKLMTWFRRPLTPSEYAQGFYHLVKREGELANMFRVFGERVRREDVETIYMHPLYMNGFYSGKYNNFTLPFLLAVEAVLDPRHEWLLLDQNTFYCQIEMYHIFLWRKDWAVNIWMGIFCDSQLNAALRHPLAPPTRRFYVNHSQVMPNLVSDIDNLFMDHFLPEHFWAKKFNPCSVLRLDQIAKCQLFCNFFMKRVSEFLAQRKRDPYERENAEYFSRREPIRKGFEWIDNHANYPPDMYQCETFNRYFCVRMMRTEAHRVVNKMFVRANLVPLMYTFTIIKNGDHFRKNPDLQFMSSFGMFFFE